MKIEQIAKVCHQVNKAYCESICDTSQPSWEDAPEWQRKSAIDGVEFVINNPGSNPSSQHESWLKMKLADGWKYGDTKDPDKKTHPCCVPYDELPVSQKAKDYIFREIVLQLAHLR